MRVMLTEQEPPEPSRQHGFVAVPYRPRPGDPTCCMLVTDVRHPADAIVIAHIDSETRAKAVASVLSAHATEYDQRVADAEYPFGF